VSAQATRKDFLDALFHTYSKVQSGFVMVKSLNRLETKVSTRYFPNVESLGREQYPGDHNVFLGLSPRDKMKPGKEHIKHVTCLWAGLDIGPEGYSGKEKHFSGERVALVALKSFPLPPSIIVRSGIGMHLYWLLRNVTEVTDVQAVEGHLRRISDYFQCRSEVGIDATLRMPDTHNNKSPASSPRCYVEYLDASVRYDLEDFEGLDLRIIIPSKRPPKIPIMPPPRPSRVRVIREPVENPDQVAEPAEAETEIPLPHGVSFASSEDESPRPIPEAKIDRLSPEEMEKLVDHFLNGFSEQMLDKLVDRIVEKLVERLTGPLSRQ
jgi:hypothetical protein